MILSYNPPAMSAIPDTGKDKKAQAAKRLRERLEKKQEESDKQAEPAARSFGMTVLFIAAAAVLMAVFGFFWDILKSLLAPFLEMPLWRQILVLFVVYFVFHGIQSSRRARKIRKLKEIEKGSD